MVRATRQALLKRRPGVRPFVLTRSNFAGLGALGAHWFGDNNSTWSDYRVQLPQMLAYTAVHQVSMVGSDVCGFNGEATENMCARWAMLGAFSPFYRNHADINAPAQEFYRWPAVADAAKKAIDVRYRLLDYLYTNMRRQSETGDPAIKPLFYHYPEDANTFAIDMQYFFGDAILVSPVSDDDSQHVDFYLPDDVFYDFWTGEQVQGAARNTSRSGVAWDDLPMHVRGGTIIPVRSESASTTTALRSKNFQLLVAPGADARATGSLYLDDGKSVDVGNNFSLIDFSWDGKTLTSSGTFGFNASDVHVEAIIFMGATRGRASPFAKDATAGSPAAEGNWPLDKPFEIRPAPSVSAATRNANILGISWSI